METIKLTPELHDTLEQVAKQQESTVNALVNQAVQNYLRDQQRAKLDQEIAEFEKLHSQLKQKYLGEWVAIHHQKLVDHDKDIGALYHRIRSKYGKTSVLIRQVTEKPIEEVSITTPSTGKASE